MADNELLPPSGAVWIGSDDPFDLHEAYLCFRRELRLERLPMRAELWISADSRYKLWVNGRFVARGPARSYPHAQCVDQLAIAEFLRPGVNMLAAQVYQPGYSHFAYTHRAAAGLLAWLDCDGAMILTTDTSWRTRRDRSFAEQVPRVSIYGSGVEQRDLALDQDWQNLAYNDAEWAAARVVAPAAGYPWTGLELRALPLLVEREIPIRLVETRRGPAAPGHDAHLALRQSWAGAIPDALEADGQGWFGAAPAAGEALFWLFDLGRDYIGQGWAEIAGAGGQEQLCLSYAEKIRDGQLVISDPQTYCRVRLTDCFELRPGEQRAETFALRGGRYLLFQLSGPAAPGLRLRFGARVAEYPLAVARELHISDPLLAGVVSLCENTFRACLLDGFVDCAWRESSQWIGDALPQALIMASIADDLRPLRRAIEMAAQGAYPDGVLPSVPPGEIHAYTVVDYNFTWVELLKLYHDLSGDAAFLERMWPTLVNLLDRFDRDRDAAGLLISQPGRRLFLDWAPLSRGEPSAVYNLHYLLALRAAAELAQARTKTEAAKIWKGRAAELCGAARAAFRHAGAWYDDLERSTRSQLVAALAILAGATCPEEEQELLAAVAARSLDLSDTPAPDAMVLASPFMHHYIFEALRRHGRQHEVVEIIRRRWGRWVEQGEPTAWENWNVDFPDGSQCHAFSAHPRYHLAEIFREREELSVVSHQLSELTTDD
jgi:alpha-L-rhamnosidase